MLLLRRCWHWALVVVWPGLVEVVMVVVVKHVLTNTAKYDSATVCQCRWPSGECRQPEERKRRNKVAVVEWCTFLHFPPFPSSALFFFFFFLYFWPSRTEEQEHGDRRRLISGPH